MKRISGITGAGPVLRDVARYLGKRFPMKPLERVSDISEGQICALSGKKPGPHCPHTKKEMFFPGTMLDKICDWHQEVFVRDCHGPSMDKTLKVAVLPDAYQSWLRERPQWSVDGQISGECTFQEKKYAQSVAYEDNDAVISKPLTGSIYAIDPNIPRSLQKLKVEVSRFHHVKNVYWKLNGTKLPFKTPSIDWPMEKGFQKFEAEVEFDDGKKALTPPIEVKVL